MGASSFQIPSGTGKSWWWGHENDIKLPSNKLYSEGKSDLWKWLINGREYIGKSREIPSDVGIETTGILVCGYVKHFNCLLEDS